MGKKKKKGQEEAKPWCYYCDRIFNDEATLVLHQKSKHFKCTTCNRKLSSAQGLLVHAYQVHKENVTSVPGAKDGRDSMEHEIFGMAGVPEGMKPGGIIDDAEPAGKRQKADDQPQQAGSYPPSSVLAGPPAYPTSTYTHIPPAQPGAIPAPGAAAGPSQPQLHPYPGYTYPAYLPGPQHLAPPPFHQPQGPPPYPGYHPAAGGPPPPTRPGLGPQYQPAPYFPAGAPGAGGLMAPPGPAPLFPVALQGGPTPQPGPLFPVATSQGAAPTSQTHVPPLFPVSQPLASSGGPPPPLFPVAGAGVATPGPGAAAAAAAGGGAAAGGARSGGPVPVPVPAPR